MNYRGFGAATKLFGTANPDLWDDPVMKITASMISELAALGLSPEQMAGVSAIIERGDADRLRKDRERKRNSKEFHGTQRNSTERTPPLPDKERSPLHPPKEINPSPPPFSEAIASSNEERAGTTSAPMARLEFDSEFWPHYPHKVGRAKAVEAYVTARRKATLDEILDGLERYKSDKPPDRPWLNPATFLNQERWNDEPAVIEIRPRNAPDRPHDAIFGALARRFEERDRDDQWQAHPHVRLVDHR